MAKLKQFQIGDLNLGGWLQVAKFKWKHTNKEIQNVLIGLAWIVGMYLMIATWVGAAVFLLGMLWWIGWTLQGMK